MTVTVTPRRPASASMASIWVLLPSTRAIQARRRAGVTAPGLIEGGGDDGGDVVGDRGGQPLPGGLRAATMFPFLSARRGDDVLRRTGRRLAVVDTGQLGHPLAAVLLARGQAGGQLGLARRGGPGGGRA